jgi:hypothetical protein
MYGELSMFLPLFSFLILSLKNTWKETEGEGGVDRARKRVRDWEKKPSQIPNDFLSDFSPCCLSLSINVHNLRILSSDLFNSVLGMG